MRTLDFRPPISWFEIFVFLAIVGMVRVVPSEGRWENLGAALGWVGIVAWSARLMRREKASAFIGGAGVLEAASDMLERLFLLRDWVWGLFIAIPVGLASVILIIAGLAFKWRDRSRG